MTIVSAEQADQLLKLRTLVGDDTYQRVFAEVWGRFVVDPPVDADGRILRSAVDRVLEELIAALRAEVAH
jgi:hypothetical protein